MTKRSHFIRAALAVTALMGLAPLPAHARSIPGHAGFPWPSSPGSCFVSGSSKMINNCSAAVTYIIPLWVNSGQEGEIFVRAKAATNNPFFPTSCRTVVDDSNGSVWASSWKDTGSTSNLTTLKLDNFFFPVRDNGLAAPNKIVGSLYLECSIAKSGGSISSVSWNF